MDHVVLRSVRDGEPVFVEAERESADDAGAWWVADLDVHNPLTSYRFLLAEGRSHPRWLNGSGVHRRDVTDAHDFRVSTEHRMPDWVLDQVGYQVFPDRFERTATGLPAPDWATPADWDDPVVHRGRTTSTQLYGGTLDGVRERLDHLTDLGATLLYLTPVFEARSNHRYDAVSFDRVDPLLGGDAALSALLGAAHGAGLRVVGDLTTNHTGSGHDWFALARADEGNLEREFYLFDGDELRVLARPPAPAQARPPVGRAGPAAVRRPGLGRGPLAARGPGRLAGRRGQHDRPARGGGPCSPGRPDRAPYGRGDAAGRLAARRARPRRQPRPRRHRLARDHGLLGVHPAGVVLAVRSVGRRLHGPARRRAAPAGRGRGGDDARRARGDAVAVVHRLDDAPRLPRRRPLPHGRRRRHRRVGGPRRPRPRPPPRRGRSPDDDARGPGGLRRRRDRADRRRRRARPHAVPVAAARRVGRPDAGGLPHLDRRTPRARRPAPRRAALARGRRRLDDVPPRAPRADGARAPDPRADLAPPACRCAPWGRTSVASPRSSGSGRSSRTTTSSSPAPALPRSPWW